MSMKHSAVAPEHQAIICLAELALGEEWEHISRVVKSLLYLSQSERGYLTVMLPAVLFFTLDEGFRYNLLKSVDTYNDEAIEYISSLQQMLRVGKYLDSNEYRMIHDAFLLNADRAVAIKEMQTESGKVLMKQRKAALRIFYKKEKKDMISV